MIKLTARQEQILALIRDAINNTGFPPTRAEIAQELGFRSANAAEEHLQALARKLARHFRQGRAVTGVGQAQAQPLAVILQQQLVGSRERIGQRVSHGAVWHSRS